MGDLVFPIHPRDQTCCMTEIDKLSYHIKFVYLVSLILINSACDSWLYGLFLMVTRPNIQRLGTQKYIFIKI